MRWRLGREAMLWWAAAGLSLVAASCTPVCPEEGAALTDDAEAGRQWWLRQLGAAEAWDRERGEAATVVAVIDNGFDLEHPDLSGQLWRNDDEVVDGRDSDGNGYVDDVDGWDFLDGDPDAGLAPPSTEDSAFRGHGTAAAGVVAAAADNKLVVAGGCPGCRLMLLRARDFLEAHDVMPRLAEALRYSIDNGARVVSLSDGVPLGRLDPDDQAEVEAALDEARAADVIVVASAGNDGADHVRWPACDEEVVAVASVDLERRPSSWTSFGEEVDLSAPGECIYTTGPEGGEGYFEGTSASAPIVAALAALVVSAHPDWTRDQVVTRLRRGARPVELDRRPELEGQMGAGVIDFGATLVED